MGRDPQAGRWMLPGLVLLVALTACREATPPFEPEDRPEVGTDLPRQLTFSSTDDRAPAWSTAGDSVFYTTEGFPPFPAGEGVLLGIPADGGSSGVLLPSVQRSDGPARWFAAGVPSPDGSRMVWAELWSVRPPELCPGTVVTCSPGIAEEPSAPRLTEVRYRARERGSDAPYGATPFLPVPLAGVEVIPSPSGPTRFAVDDHPFQRLFRFEEAFVFRPSWSPDGGRVVLSDGLRLLLWEPGSTSVTPVPGTDDGVGPAWSPDGEWIAFTRLDRGAPILTTCEHFAPLGVACVQERTIHPVAGRRIVLVRPDGSEVRALGPGEEPAWTPDGEGLVVSREGTLWRMGTDGGGATSIPGTGGAREPAVSPDGSSVAFTRRDAGGDFDVWLTALPGGGP